MTIYLSIIASAAISIYIIKEGYKLYELINEWYTNRQQIKQYTNDHPELKGVDINNGFMTFIAPNSIRDRIINNNEEGDNIPMLSKGYGFIEDGDDDDDDDYEFS